METHVPEAILGQEKRGSFISCLRTHIPNRTAFTLRGSFICARSLCRWPCGLNVARKFQGARADVFIGPNSHRHSV